MGTTICSGSEFPLPRMVKLWQFPCEALLCSGFAYHLYEVYTAVETSDLDRSLEGLELPFLLPLAFCVVDSFLCF